MSDKMFLKPGRAEQDLKWAEIWFSKLCAFHKREGQADWDFGPDEVIAFLRSKRDAGVPAWKRMKIIRGLLVFRRFVQHRGIDPLIPIERKMKEIVQIERAKTEGYDTIEESVGKIDPRGMRCDPRVSSCPSKSRHGAAYRTILRGQGPRFHARSRVDVPGGFRPDR